MECSGKSLLRVTSKFITDQVLEISTTELTATPSGKQRQKKSGRGLPTASLMATVRMAVMRTENKTPTLACIVCTSEMSYGLVMTTSGTNSSRKKLKFS
jgi:hypothetical protein